MRGGAGGYGEQRVIRRHKVVEARLLQMLMLALMNRVYLLELELMKTKLLLDFVEEINLQKIKAEFSKFGRDAQQLIQPERGSARLSSVSSDA